jgi:MYXO-CTERM domain-containing protein
LQSQSRPTVSFDGRDSIVTWTDDRRASSTDVYAARVKIDGTVRDPNGFAISAEDTHDAAGSAAFSSDGRGIVLYERPDPELGFSYRARARAVCTHGAVATETACDGEDEDCDGVVDDDGVCDEPEIEIDAGSAEEDAGADDDGSPPDDTDPEPGTGTGGTGSAGMDPGAMAHMDAGITNTSDAGEIKGDDDTVNDGGKSIAPPPTNKADSGCQCTIERADRPLPFGLIAFAVLAGARLIARRRARR